MKNLVILFLMVAVVLADRKPPIGWGDFQIGTVNNGRTHWDEPMKAAFNNTTHNYMMNRRYLYIADTNDVKSYWGRDGGANKNWSKDPYYMEKKVGNAITIYMLQKGGDSFDIISTNTKNKDWMKAYFDKIRLIVDSTKNTGIPPIYVIEPDVWTYILQKTREENQSATTWNDVNNNHLDDFCHINDLGYSWLSEFDNRLGDLPGAIIKTIKYFDPEAYAGALIGFWGWRPTGASHIGYFDETSDLVADGALQAATYMDSLLSGTPYRGDFCGIEKNGTDMGYWKSIGSDYGDYLDWDDRQNADWMNFAKTISLKTDLPMVGWQIAIGHSGLPNTLNSYTDTFFPYFFSHFDDALDAGFIGMLAGVANQDRGTIPVPEGYGTFTNSTFGEQTEGDKGWFFNKIEELNANRPYFTDDKEYYEVIATIIPDTVITDSTTNLPQWDSTTTYGKWDSEVKHDSLIAHNGSTWRLVGWENTNKEPGQYPDIWQYVGPVGTWEEVMGGTVFNDEIYFEKGSNVHKKLNIVADSGYGVEWIKVNGQEVAIANYVDIPNISSDANIEIKFSNNGSQVAINSTKTVTQNLGYKIKNNSIIFNLNMRVQIYSINGRVVVDKNVSKGDVINTSSFSNGLYFAKFINNDNKVSITKLSIH